MGDRAEMEELSERSIFSPTTRIAEPFHGLLERSDCNLQSPNQTSRILSPSKLDIPKRKKGWERSARPATGSDSKVKVVWEKWDLRRAKAGVGSRRLENGKDAEKPSASPPRVVKKARVAAHPGHTGQQTKSKDYVVTGRERRASRSPSRRKLPAVEEQSALHNASNGEDHDGIDAHVGDGYPAEEDLELTQSEDDEADIDGEENDDAAANAQGEPTVTQTAVHSIQAEAASSPSRACTDHVTWEGATPNRSFAPPMHSSTTKLSNGQSSDSNEEGGTVDKISTAVTTSTIAPASPQSVFPPLKIGSTSAPSVQQTKEFQQIAVQKISQGVNQKVDDTEAMGLGASREYSAGRMANVGENTHSQNQEAPVETMTGEKDLSLTDLDLCSGITKHESRPEKVANNHPHVLAGGVIRKLLVLPSIDDLSVFQDNIWESPLPRDSSQTPDTRPQSPSQPFPALEDDKEVHFEGGVEESSLPTLIKVDFNDEIESELAEDELSDDEDGLDYNDTMKLNGLQPYVSSEVEGDDQEAGFDEDKDNDGNTAEVALHTEDGPELANNQVEAESDSDESTEACQARDVTVPILPSHDDKAILSSFLARAAASKAARSSVVTRRASLQNRLESETVRQALSSPSRQALEERDANISPCQENAVFASPSTAVLPGLQLRSNDGSRPASPSVGILKFKSALPPSPTPEPVKRVKKQQDVSESPLRRSLRNASNPQASVASAAAEKLKSISVSMQDTPDPTSLAIEAEAKRLINQTRNNTRKNKGPAVGVRARLKQLKGTARGNAPGHDTVEVVEAEVIEDDRGATKLRWREIMCDYQEAPVMTSPIRSRAPIRKAPASRIRISRMLAATMSVGAGNGDESNLDEEEESSDHDQPVSDQSMQAKVSSPQKKKPGKQRQLKKPQIKQAVPSEEILQKLILPDEHLADGEESQLNGTAVSNITAAPSSLPMPINTESSSSVNGRPDTRIPTAKDSRDFKSGSVNGAMLTQSWKLPSLILAPSVKSISAPAVNGLNSSDGKENLVSKLRSPKKISMLPIPTPSLLGTTALSTMQAAGRPAAHGATAPTTDSRMNGLGEAGALSTPARKRAGIRRKKAI